MQQIYYRDYSFFKLFHFNSQSILKELFIVIFGVIKRYFLKLYSIYNNNDKNKNI